MEMGSMFDTILSSGISSFRQPAPLPGASCGFFVSKRSEAVEDSIGVTMSARAYELPSE